MAMRVDHAGHHHLALHVAPPVEFLRRLLALGQQAHDFALAVDQDAAEPHDLPLRIERDARDIVDQPVGQRDVRHGAGQQRGDRQNTPDHLRNLRTSALVSCRPPSIACTSA